ncbi:MAG: hypothetical protein ACE5EM_09600 [Sphingomonadales bacterium]
MFDLADMRAVVKVDQAAYNSLVNAQAAGEFSLFYRLCRNGLDKHELCLDKGGQGDDTLAGRTRPSRAYPARAVARQSRASRSMSSSLSAPVNASGTSGNEIK